jgi:hypothetical protein
MVNNVNSPTARQVGASAAAETLQQSEVAPTDVQSHRSLVSTGMGPLSPRAAQSRLSKSDKKLAPYLLGRHVVGRRVQEPELDVLRRANKTVEEVRDVHMDRGRANVLSDVLKTDGRSALLGAVAREIDTFIHENGLGSPEVRAGVLSTIGAGTCNEHAAVAQYAHAKELAQGEQVNTVISLTRKHVFAVTKPVTGDGPNVVMDAWADGPAVNIADANYMNHFGANITNIPSPDPTTSENALSTQQKFQHGIEELGPGQQIQRKFHQLLQSQSPEEIAQKVREEIGRGVVRPNLYVEAVPVISEAFAAKVAHQLESVPLPDGHRVEPQASPQTWLNTLMNRRSSLVQEQDQMRRHLVQSVPEYRAHAQVLTSVQAAGVARELGADVKAAALAAPDIVDGAKNLRRLDPSRPADPTPPDNMTQENR